MGIANDMKEIPEKPKTPTEPWSFKRLFPLKATVSSLTKSFTTPFDILLVFQILILGVSELIGREVSWLFYILTLATLVADVVERYKTLPVQQRKSAILKPVTNKK